MNDKKTNIEKNPQTLDFVSFVFEVMDKNRVPSRITISSVAFLVGGDIYKREADEAGEDTTIEECVAECAMEIFNSIEDDFTILNIL
jgi:hypothetical protein